MIFFGIFTVFWLIGGAALGYLTSTLKTGLHVIWIAAIVWGLSIGIGWPAPHGSRVTGVKSLLSDISS
jgi:hypothetical protein